MSANEVHHVSGTRFAELKPSLPAFHFRHSAAWRRRQYGNYSALMHFSGPTWLTVSRGSRTPEIGLMRIMSACRFFERERSRKGEKERKSRSYRPPLSIWEMHFRQGLSVRVHTSALPAEFPFTSGESLTS